MFKGAIVDGTHKLGFNRGILYCMSCGYYAINKVGKLAESCLLKPANATEACMLKRMNKGSTPTRRIAFPHMLCSANGEIKAYISSEAKKSAMPWAISKHLPNELSGNTGSVAQS